MSDRPDDPAASPGPVRVAWAWVDHVRAGGSTPWRDFAAGCPDPLPPEDATTRGRLPGAAQLELARRLAERAGRAAAGIPGSPARATPDLLERAMDRSGPGRGLAVLPLDLTPAGGHPAPGTPRVGAPPTDPADVPVDELVRLAVGLLVDEVLRAGPPDPPGPGDRAAGPRLPRVRPLSRAVPVAGAAADAAALRARRPRLPARPGAARAVPVLLVAAPMETLLAQAWSARVQHGAGVPWPRFVRRCAGKDALPATADLASLAATWASRVGPDRVHVLAGHDPLADAADVLGGRARWSDPGAAGARRRPAPAGAAVRPLGAAGVDLLRRVNRVLSVRLPTDRRAAVRRAVADLLPDGAAGSPGLAVPAAHRAWAAARAERVADGLRRGGYPVHGDPGRVVDRPGGPDRPRRADVLDLLLDTLLAVGGGPGPGRAG